MEGLRTLVLSRLPSSYVWEELDDFLLETIEADQVEAFVRNGETSILILLKGPSYMDTAKDLLHNTRYHHVPLDCRFGDLDDQDWALTKLTKGQPTIQQSDQAQGGASSDTHSDSSDAAQKIINLLKTLSTDARATVLQAFKADGGSTESDPSCANTDVSKPNLCQQSSLSDVSSGNPASTTVLQPTVPHVVPQPVCTSLNSMILSSSGGPIQSVTSQHPGTQGLSMPSSNWTYSNTASGQQHHFGGTLSATSMSSSQRGNMPVQPPVGMHAPFLTTRMSTASSYGSSLQQGHSTLPTYGATYQPNVTPVGPPPTHSPFVTHTSAPATQVYAQSMPFQQFPRLSGFSGSTAKGEVTYPQWKYEIDCLIQEGMYPEPLIMQAIRRSARGAALDVLRNTAHDNSVASMMERLDLIFGNVQSSDYLYEEYWKARQSDQEPAAVWGCRLEELLSQLTEKGAVDSESRCAMLRSKFFHGLRMETMQARLQHYFDNGASYETLLRHARQLEAGPGGGDKVPKAKVASVQPSRDVSSDADVAKKLDLLLREMNTLKSEVDSLKKSQSTAATGSGQPVNPGGRPQQMSQRGRGARHNNQRQWEQFEFQGYCRKCNTWGHKARHCHLN